MAAAERLARRGLGKVWPNPAVAALLVNTDDAGNPVVVGRGVTSRPGMAHAEVNALNQAGEKARGSTCYVTLEPCSHYGRTPPCSLALREAGVARVVVGMADPNPRVSGRGIAMLRDGGVEVAVGVREDSIRDLYSGFSLRQTEQRPSVFLKLAVSRDGFIGRKGDGQIRISGELSMRKVHGFRAEADAILIGIGTALADDPQLTCRLPGLKERSPVRVVIDRMARLPVKSKLVSDCVDHPVWLVCGFDAPKEQIDELSASGVNVIRVPSEDGLISPKAILGALSTRGITRVMVEGGARIATSFLEADLVDEICIVTGKCRIGEGGVPPLIQRDIASLLKDPKFKRVETGWYGSDRFMYLKHIGT